MSDLLEKYESVIGLEVHVQLDTKSKLFCSSDTSFGATPNQNTSPVCLGLPGSLPVLNEEALHLAVKAGLALGCEVAERLKFDRKHYFYPDLPKAYQISQFDMPVNGRGSLEIEVPLSKEKIEKKTIGITRAHLEEDAGKLLHEGIQDGSLVDYNRAGMPLLEIVSDPDIRTPQEAYEYLKSLKAVMQYAEVSDCNMEEGSLRCDANVSIRLRGAEEFGTRAEIKNLNSFKMVQKALEYEIQRQIRIVEQKGEVVQETRLWNDAKQQTFSMRSKEEAHDYRYFPDPDLVPFTIEQSMVQDIKEALPELPREKKARFMKEYGLSNYDAHVLVQEKKLADYFEACLKDKVNAKTVSNWIQSELLALLNEKKLGIEESPVEPKRLAALVKLIDDGTINGKIAKDVLPMLFDSQDLPADIVKAKGLMQVTDTSQLEGIADKIIEANPKVVDDFKNGKKQALGFLVGQIMKETQGKANPKIINEILTSKLT